MDSASDERGRELNKPMPWLMHEYSLPLAASKRRYRAEESHVLSIGIIRWGARECGQISGNQFF